MSAVMQADGAAPTTNEIIARLETSLATPTPLEEEIQWATRASPLVVAERVRSLMGIAAQTVAENRELRELVKSQAPTVEMRVYGPIDHCAALLTGAWLLEQRGDKCAVAFKRDDEGHIAGLALSVEDL